MYDVTRNAFFSLKTNEKLNPKWYQGEPVSDLVLAMMLCEYELLVEYLLLANVKPKQTVSQHDSLEKCFPSIFLHIYKISGSNCNLLSKL